jgi:steroid 5-alpha reductase family enzyme
MNVWLLALVSLGGLCLLFAGVYAIARRIENYGIVDIAWSYAFGVLALFCALFATGWAPRRWLLASLVLLWSLRLGTHLHRRVVGHHPREDGRYVEMRRRWNNDFNRKMFGFYQMQAVSVVILGLPFLLTMRNTAVGFHPLELAGAILWVISIVGEALADAQLNAFKRRADKTSPVCDAGLWRYSRHPNYFFEWLIWVAYFLFAAASPWGWLGILSPAAILYLLLKVTGIPMTEEQAVRSKGDAYRRYQKTTSAFVPWFRKTIPSTVDATPRPQQHQRSTPLPPC